MTARWMLVAGTGCVMAAASLQLLDLVRVLP